MTETGLFITAKNKFSALVNAALDGRTIIRSHPAMTEWPRWSYLQPKNKSTATVSRLEKVPTRLIWVELLLEIPAG